MATSKHTVITDAVHDQLVIHEVCKAVIDTPEFQRLRYISQSGASNFVYPTSNHTRFEHSIGVCHYAKLFMDNLDQRSRETDPNEKISERDKLRVQLAGLCHDLGHGPFSHTWELFVKKSRGPEAGNYRHESMSMEIFRHIFNKYEHVRNTFKEYDLCEHDVDVICDIIGVDKEMMEKVEPSRKYLYQIIANKIGIDVDKLEYLKRDARQFGMNFSIDMSRILNNTMKFVDEKGDTIIAYKEKIHGNLFDVFLARAKMHLICYQHPVIKLIEVMLLDVLKEADQYVSVNYIDKNGQYGVCKMSECHESLEAYVQLDNSVIRRIHQSCDPQLNTAKCLLNRIYNRQLYTQIFAESISNPGVSQKQHKQHIENLAEFIISRLEREFDGCKGKFRYSVVKIDMGDQGAQDPLAEARFYNKDKQLISLDKPMDKSLISRFYSSNSLFSYNSLLIFCTAEDLTDAQFNSMHKSARNEWQGFEKSNDFIRIINQNSA